jgi:hypothetical protein
MRNKQKETGYKEASDPVDDRFAGGRPGLFRAAHRKF